MKRFSRERLAAWAVVVLALALLVFGTVHTHQVFDPTVEEFGMVAFMKLPDWQMVIDSTFGGVTRKDGKLYSTYDRAESRGKRACPT
ncbi:MAG: hypothetical protein K1Y02_07755 [Candidatus Hydrogenedentes bacterium]|nr:hypothetical protein [Candidatus Hydrogenedentota bacterium]